MNMIRIYLKQAWETARQNRLFSSIYVVGTGLSIALTMTLFIIFYVKTAPIYPEYNRDRTLVVRYVKSYPADKPENWNAGLVSPTLVELADSLPHVDDVAVTMSSSIRGQYVALPGQKQTFNIFLLYVNADFWRVFPFRFLSGKPLTEADVEARTPTAVISESLARRLFASTDVAGKTFHYRGRPYTVSGVVQDVSSATPDVVADVWMPLSLDAASSFDDPDFGLQGNLTCFLLVDDADNKEAVKESLREAVRRHDAGRERVNDLMGQPDDAALSTFRTNPANAPDTDGLFRSLLYIVLALLFPALHPRRQPERHDCQPHGPPHRGAGHPQGIRRHTGHAAWPGAVGEPAAHARRGCGRAGVLLRHRAYLRLVDTHSVRHGGENFAAHALPDDGDAVQSLGISLHLRPVPGAQRRVGSLARVVGAAAHDCGGTLYEAVNRNLIL